MGTRGLEGEYQNITIVSEARELCVELRMYVRRQMSDACMNEYGETCAHHLSERRRRENR